MKLILYVAAITTSFVVAPSDHPAIASLGGQGGLVGFLDQMDTPRKTNMEPENASLEEEIPIRNHHFQVPC